jgi:hypothetical protein
MYILLLLSSLCEKIKNIFNFNYYNYNYNYNYNNNDIEMDILIEILNDN